MKPVRTKSDLIRELRPFCPTRVCERAMDEGRVTVIGGFTPPNDFSQWVIRIESRYGQIWYLSLCCDTNTNRYKIRLYMEDEVPWKYWDGENCNSAIVRGEVSEECVRKQGAWE